MPFDQEIEGLAPGHANFVRMFRQGLIKTMDLAPLVLTSESVSGNRVHADAGVADLKSSFDEFIATLINNGTNIRSCAVKVAYSSTLRDVVQSVSVDLDLTGPDSTPVCMCVQIRSQSLK